MTNGGEYQRRRTDELVDSRLTDFDHQLSAMTGDLKDIRERMIRLETRISVAVLLATALITLAALVGPVLARIALPQQ